MSTFTICVCYNFLQLYTAFFKWNVQKQLQDMDAVFCILKSLGYSKTEEDVDQVSVKEPDVDRAIWVSLDLFLVQLELQIIKEIMDNTPESKCTLKDIVKARRRTYTVEAACNYLFNKAAKRQKLDAAQGGDAASDKLGKETMGGGVNATFSHGRQGIGSADHSSSTHSKDRPLSSASKDVPMDFDDSSTGFIETKKDQSARVTADYKEDEIRRHLLVNMNPAGNVSDHDLYGLDFAGSQPRGARQHRFDTHYDESLQTRPLPNSDDTVMGTGVRGSYSLPYIAAMTPMHLSHQYLNQGYTNYTERNQEGINVVTQSHAVRPATRAEAQTNAIRSKITVRAVTQVQGTSESDKVANLRDSSSYPNHHRIFGTRDTVIRPNDTSALIRQHQVSLPEPVKVKQAGMPNNLANGMAEGALGRHTTQAGVTDLNTTLEHHLTIASNSVGAADNTSQRLSGAPKEQRNPNDSQKLASEKDAAKSQDRSARESHMSDREIWPGKSSFLLDTKSTSVAEGAYQAVPNAADVKRYTVQRIEANETSVPSARNLEYKPSSVHGDLLPSDHRTTQVPYPAHSSRNDLHSGDVSSGSQAGETQQKDHAAICDMCMSDGTSICRNCFKFVCGKCKEIYTTDLCSATKGQHKFKDLKKIPKQRSANLEALSSQRGASLKEGVEDEGTEWSCSRCTYLNPPEHGVCAMCATSRGFSSVEQLKPGSRVCGNCTFHNKQDVKVCGACHKTLDLAGPHVSFV